MKKNQAYIANPHMTGENRLPARTLLLPALKRGVTHKNFAESDMIKLLSGDWKFSYISEDTDESFFDPAFDDSSWDVLPVPSMWQFNGYGSCFYPNVRYCFPFDPPYIHCDNPVGLYRKSFNVEKLSDSAIIRFLGVDNAYFVWLNGEYVGFSKGSRIPAEFDVTPFLREGENILAVKVYTYSDASYLENQDMLMASGIFRDVMLIQTGKNSLWDYTVIPRKDGLRIKYSASVGKEGAKLSFSLFDADEDLISEAQDKLKKSGEVFLPVEESIGWNAEEPYLYTLYIEITEDGEISEAHTKKVGFAFSTVDGIYLKMNGKPITLKGVNRHENNCRTGRAITTEQIERELRDIKERNLNAIRCSHYTNQPLFYELCSELGIYVMDEADCETHGAEAAGDQGALNKDPEWFDAFFDRVSRMYFLNKNETCVNIWSLGNECGEGENSENAARWLTEQDVRKPIKGNGAPECGAIGHFAQTGYMPMKTLYDSEKDPKHPLMMVEYAHAMGNSPGGLEDIWNWIYEHEHCCGGYVWEFKSHGFFTEGRDGKPRYLYGGDFPDVYHWSNFSLDGYHTSDGTPKPTWFELGEVSAPVYVRFEKDCVTVKNTFDFRSLDGVKMRWSVREDGKVIRSGEIPLDGIEARGSKCFSLPVKTYGSEGIVTLDCGFFDANKKIAHKQKILSEGEYKEPAAKSFSHSLKAENNDVEITGNDFSILIKDGLLASIIREGKTVLDSPMRLNCMHAPIDNEESIFVSHGREWEDKLVHSMKFGCYDVFVDDKEDRVTVTSKGKFLPFSHMWGFNTTIEYIITSGGEIEIALSLDPYGDGPAILPRVGVVFELEKEFDHVSWLGRGPADNYHDCKANAPVGLYESDVEKMNFLYDVPQETGNRCDCRRVTVSSEDSSLEVNGKFDFSFHDFSLENLIAARHFDELEKSGKNYLYIDHRTRGLGSSSCGPEPEKEYELVYGRFEWRFVLKTV